MPDTIFDFLLRLSPLLAQQYTLAYRYCYEDPENSLVKLRACAVLLVEGVYRHYRLDKPDNLFDSLNLAGIHDYMPYHIQENLNFLRVEGNKGAHPGMAFRSRKAAQQTALRALKTAYNVAAWAGEILLRETRAPEFEPPSEAHSDKLYGDAVARNNAEAQYSVGMLFRAQDSPQAREDARYWLGKAASRQHPAAVYQLGLLALEENTQAEIAKGERLIREAAVLGDIDALYHLGCFLLEGSVDGKKSCAQDAREAFRCFTEAARHEHLGALNRLVQMYYEGLGVPLDHDKAFEYAYKAAQAGYPSAQFKLAHLYQSGCGVVPSLGQAFLWYEKAAQAGYADAQVVLFKFYSNGLHVEKDLLKALEWLALAEAQDHPGACYYLGLAYQRGIGVPADSLRALNLFKRCLEFDRDRQYEQAATLEFAQGVALLRAQAVKAATARARNPPAGDRAAGRNDPCPCGSGKKYKKCCLYAE